MSLSHLAGVDPEPRTASLAPNAGRCHNMSRTYSVWMPRLQFWEHRIILSCCAKSENGLAEDGSHHGNQMKNLHFWTEQKLSQTQFWIFLLVLWKNDLGVPRFQRKPAVLREPAPHILPARLYKMPPNSRLQILWLDFCSQLQKKAERKSDTEVIYYLFIYF